MNEEYIKNFDDWNEYAKKLEAKKLEGSFHEGEIWWCALGTNIGSEEDGKHGNFERPILIIRLFGRDTSWVIPLTTRPSQKGSRVHYSTSVKDVSRTFKLSQLRNISNKRLLRYSDTISSLDFRTIRKLLSELM